MVPGLQFTSTCAFRHSGVLRHPNFKKCSDSSFFNIFTSKSAFRHSGVQCCDIRPRNVLRGPQFFHHFHFHLCFSPQRRAMLRHPTFEKCSEDKSFVTFLLLNALFATAACNVATRACHHSAILRDPTCEKCLRHPSCEKCFEDHSFLTFSTFSLPNVFLATAA